MTGTPVTRTFKNTVQSVLQRFDYRIAYSPRRQVGGFTFSEDIRLLVKSPKPVCFDVGANEGQSVREFQKIFKNARIYAFEPAKECFQRLNSRVRSSDVHLYNFALGNENVKRQFWNYEDSCLSSVLELDGHGENRFRGSKVKSKEVIDIKTIDWFLGQEQIKKIDLLKIDTQGYDLQVLQGAAQALQDGVIDNVFIELNFVRIYQNQSDARRISDFLAEYGFYLVDYYDKERQGHRLAWCNALYSRQD